MSKETYAKLVIYHLTKAADPKDTLKGLRHLAAAYGILLGYAHKVGDNEVTKALLEWRKELDKITDMYLWLSLDENHWWNEGWDDEFIEDTYTEEKRERNFYTIHRLYSRVLHIGHWAMAKLGLGEAVDIPDISEFIKGGIAKKATQEDEEDDDTY